MLCIWIKTTKDISKIFSSQSLQPDKLYTCLLRSTCAFSSTSRYNVLQRNREKYYLCPPQFSQACLTVGCLKSNCTYMLVVNICNTKSWSLINIKRTSGFAQIFCKAGSHNPFLHGMESFLLLKVCLHINDKQSGQFFYFLPTLTLA